MTKESDLPQDKTACTSGWTDFEFAKELETKETKSENVVLFHLVQFMNKHCIFQLQFFPEDSPHLVDQAEVGQATLILGIVVERKDAEEIFHGMLIGKEEFVHCTQEASAPSSVCASCWNPELHFINSV